MMKDVGLNCTMSRYPKNSNGKSENDIEIIFIKRMERALIASGVIIND